MYFHASAENIGETVLFDRGGHYEKVDEHGSVHARYAGNNHVGFEVSEVPELCASERPEAAVFAKVQNLTQQGVPGEHSIIVSVYRLEQEPDIRIRDIQGDFKVLDEVRYRNPSNDPVKGELYTEVEIPSRLLGDIQLAYLPPGKGIITEWAESVQEQIREILEGGEYDPDRYDCERPDPEAYRQKIRA